MVAVILFAMKILWKARLFMVLLSFQEVWFYLDFRGQIKGHGTGVPVARGHSLSKGAGVVGSVF